MSPKDRFPIVQPGGSLLLAWQVKGKKVLIVGGGEVAAGRLLACLNADANVTLICPASGLNPEVSHRLSSLSRRITHVPRNFEPSDLDDPPPSLVLIAIDDPAASTEIYELCKSRRLPVNVADVPPECDFYFGSIHRDGPLQIMVSTNGNGPRLAAMVRRMIAERLPKGIGAAIEKVGVLRRELRETAPEPEQGRKRMRWMSKVCDKWTLDELREMDKEDMRVLLEGYQAGKVKSFEEVRLGEEDDGVVWRFDGSFGWF